MSFERDNETPPALNNFSVLHGHSLQQYYGSSTGAPLNPQRLNRNNVSPAPSAPPVSSPSVGGGYPFPMYSSNSFPRYSVSMNLAAQKLSTQSQQNSLSSIGTPALHSSSEPTFSGAASTHMARQLTYAQLSRQSASPHHHARTAAAMARNTPVGSTVTITDPNNPSKSFNGLIGKGRQEEDSRTGAKPPTSSSSTGLQDHTWTTLDLGGMGIKNLSPALCSYTFLTILYMNHNNLSFLTPAISNLVNLKTLDVSGNKLTSIPPELGLLINLRELLLFDNNLVTLPSELGTLYQLEVLGLEGNPIQADIKNLLMKEGTAAVIMSLRENAPGTIRL